MEDEGVRLIANCVESAMKLVKAVVEQLPPEARETLNLAILANAKVQLTVELYPRPAVRSSVECAGQVIQLFEVQLKKDCPSPILN
jgi:hypothetical protein